jgi:hypothetical protein
MTPTPKECAAVLATHALQPGAGWLNPMSSGSTWARCDLRESSFPEPIALMEVVRSVTSVVWEAPVGAVHDGFQKVESP